MRKLILIMLMSFLIFPITAHAKSFTVDRVQIKGWVQLDGEMLVNEVFTYTFDGSFSRLTRSFPEEHISQIRGFEAYLINDRSPIVGEIDGSTLSQAQVSAKGSTYSTSIKAENETVSVLYVYRMQYAVKSYDTYSDLAVTFFEDGFNHEDDLNNISIDYVLPGDVGDDNIHGFMHDREGLVSKVYRNGISFHTPVSVAYTETGTRVFFPSSIMTGQSKYAAPLPLTEAIQQEKDLIAKKEARWSNIPTVTTAADGLRVLFIVSIILVLLLRQRIIPLFGSTDLVLRTDPTYLSLIDQNGKFNRKSFLSGLFSLVEKGVVKAELADSASRFHGEDGAPEKTLVFQLQSGQHMKNLLPHEQYLITWLFRGRAGHRKFHLHDIAGPSIEVNKNDRVQSRKQHKFVVNHEAWHDNVLKLMIEAGALSTMLTKILKTAIILLLTILMMFGFYADGAGGWGIAFPVIVAGLGYYFYVVNPGKKWPAVLLFIGLFFVGAQTMDATITDAVLQLVIVGIILFLVIPKALPRSFTALYTKMSIAKFQMKLRWSAEPPHHLHPEDIDRWMARAYLLNPSKKRLPKFKGSLPDAYPLAPLFALQVDPLYFAYSTWGPTSMAVNKGGSSGGGSDYGGGYSGGGGGGGDGGGGGAGAD
ncbi:DUF2207 domain-containing protein [Sporosarcina highlanderae]|uniref:DUF2207 domain-containing protein n=1 Tax=Sporosarcina highlanderae TaxID=3035916 RepID=A0ABT8JNM7_9BACL|nr:DUF2207 domain-containing protein [Sporosarcina highlanderae]MDN4606642.1 DUF2207 domain-containing protein [Sporosarcina highlanderae]